MFKIKSNFVGNFKIGDNIEYNCEILKHLYKCLNNSKRLEKKYLYKPIIITIISIIEAMLYDFIEIRIVTYTNEGVKNISNDILESIREKRINGMSQYIDCIEKHNLFGKRGYKTLDELRKLRNRIHIQNLKHFELDEEEVFNETRKVSSEKMLEKIVKFLSTKYPRGRGLNCCNDFEFPWQEHLNPKGYKKTNR